MMTVDFDNEALGPGAAPLAQKEMLRPGSLALQVRGVRIEVCPQKALYLPDHGALVVADVHFGKAAHMRRHGLAIPEAVEAETLSLLTDLVALYQPRELVVAGDLFHSERSAALSHFGHWRTRLPEVQVGLVRGNHDILPGALYAELGVDLLGSEHAFGPIRLCHHPLDEDDPRLPPPPDRTPGHTPDPDAEAPYYLSGHLHPGYRLGGAGRQGLTLPCLWLGARQGVLPAFGAFTGLMPITAAPGDRLALFGPVGVYAHTHTPTRGRGR